jgi:hypothetical protein
MMDALVEAAKARRRPRDVAIFMILRYTGRRRESPRCVCIIWTAIGACAASA